MSWDEGHPLNGEAESVDELADDDKVWICQACGKESRTVSGFDGMGRHVASRGWDVSCALNARLCDRKTKEPVSDG